MKLFYVQNVCCIMQEVKGYEEISNEMIVREN